MCIYIYMGVSMSKHVHLHLHGCKLGKWKGICETEPSRVFNEAGQEGHKIHEVYLRYIRGGGETEGYGRSREGHILTGHACFSCWYYILLYILN